MHVNLGIGTTSPGAKLAVSGGATVGASYATTTAPTNGMIIEGNVGIGTVGPTSKLYVNGSAHIQGTLSKTSGSFAIPHPDPEKAKDNWFLRHCFVESPTRGDNLYRWTVEVNGGELIIELPDYFRYLNENAQVWVAPKGHFGRAFGEVNPELTQVIIKADKDGEYNVLLVATRKDKDAIGFDKLGVEYQAKDETSPPKNRSG